MTYTGIHKYTRILFLFQERTKTINKYTFFFNKPEIRLFGSEVFFVRAIID